MRKDSLLDDLVADSKPVQRRSAKSDALFAASLCGAWGGFVLAFACPHDDLLYSAFWYAIGCGAVALAARLVLPVAARW